MLWKTSYLLLATWATVSMAAPIVPRTQSNQSYSSYSSNNSTSGSSNNTGEDNNNNNSNNNTTSLDSFMVGNATITRFNYGVDKIRGVNLGGWLVLEPWMTPSLFQNVDDSVQSWDEWTLSEVLGEDEFFNHVKPHYDSFITQDDFKQIKQAGLNHVRIPIGYWAFEKGNDEPYAQGQLEYLKKAVSWSRDQDIKVNIDLHGLPGSQNGYDNSGKKGEVNWAKDDKNIKRSEKLVKQVLHEFKQDISDGVVTMIQVINEPAAFDPSNGMSVSDDNGVLRQYYLDAYKLVDHSRKLTKEHNTSLVYTIHDGFSLNSWNDFMQPEEYQDVSLDHHEYTVFDPNMVDISVEDRAQVYCSKSDSLSSANQGLWTFVGEWSPALSDCAGAYGQGIGGGALYESSQRGCDGMTGPVEEIDDDVKQGLKKMFDTQRYVYETTTNGWFMWSWKTESVADWSYVDGIKGGWIPESLDETSLDESVCN